jgi:hypothetical protein
MALAKKAPTKAPQVIEQEEPARNLPAKRGNTAVGASTAYQQRMAEIAARAVGTEASVSTGNFIATKSGLLKYNGQPFPGNQLNAVVVDHILENTFYTGDYDPDNPGAPKCYAFGRDEKDMRPHENVAEPQSETCKTCQWNKFKTADNGKGKACKNIRRLGLIPANTNRKGELELDPDVVAGAEIAYLKVPVTSVRGWALYVRSLEVLEGMPPAGVVTNISCEPDDQTTFRMNFAHVQTLDEDIGMAVLDKLAMVEQEIMAPYPDPEDNAEEVAAKPATKPAAKAAPAKGAPARRKF